MVVNEKRSFRSKLLLMTGRSDNAINNNQDRKTITTKGTAATAAHNLIQFHQQTRSTGPIRQDSCSSHISTIDVTQCQASSYSPRCCHDEQNDIVVEDSLVQFLGSRQPSFQASTSNNISSTSSHHSNKSSDIKQKKQVQFHETVDFIPEDSSNHPNVKTKSAMKERWYTPRDYTRFQTANAMMARGLVKSMPNYVKAVRSTYQLCCHPNRPSLLHQQLLHQLEQHHSQKQEQQQHQQQSFRGGFGLRRQNSIRKKSSSSCLSYREQQALQKVLDVELVGLEDICLSDKMEERRAKMQRTVLNYQYRYNPERLRKACQTISRPCGLIAQELAKAQAEI